MKNLSFAVALTFALIITTVSFAQPQGGPGHGMKGFGPEPNMNMITNRLNLTDEQSEQFQDLLTNMKKDAIKIRSQIELKKLDIETALRAKDFKPESLVSLSADIDKLQSDLRKARITFWTDVYKTLDENQQAKWKKGFLRFMKNVEDAQRVGLREMKEKRMDMMRKEKRMSKMKNDQF
ncbi:MAG: periplasmic heavy metal sensor [Chlorobi bacterium]|nr:periplasmic heavy metal sensor [Chlorobiota bacterium]